MDLINSVNAVSSAASNNDGLVFDLVVGEFCGTARSAIKAGGASPRWGVAIKAVGRTVEQYNRGERSEDWTARVAIRMMAWAQGICPDEACRRFGC